MMTQCPSPHDQELYALDAARDLPYSERRALIQHLRFCPHCQRRQAETQAILERLRDVEACDPGPAFSEAVVTHMGSPSTLRALPGQMPPLGRLLTVALLCIAAVVLALIWWLPERAGTDRVTVAAPPTLLAGGACVVPVRVTTRDGRPIPHSTVTLRAPGAHPFTGYTNAQGFCPALLTVPTRRGLEGAVLLEVLVATPTGRHRVALPVRIIEARTLQLATDAPVYQPGQTMHVRLLCIRRADASPVVRQPATLTLWDARGTLLVSRTLTTSAWGVASDDLPCGAGIAPGTYTLMAQVGDAHTTRTITVAPAMVAGPVVTVAADRPWFQPGDAVTGTVTAVTPLGRPSAAAHVRVTATFTTPDGTETRADADTGTTDAQGRCPFTLRLPTRATPPGGTLVWVTATLTDARGQQGQAARAYPVASETVLVSVLPEAGTPVPGVENTCYVVTSYPDGQPASAEIRLSSPETRILHTDAAGIATFDYTPSSPTIPVELSAIAAHGRRGRFVGTLGAIGTHTVGTEWPTPTVLLRTDKARYQPGDVVRVTATAPGAYGTLTVQVSRDGQPLFARTGTLAGGTTTVNLPLSKTVDGVLTIAAFLPVEQSPRSRLLQRGYQTMIAAGSRAILVHPDPRLTVTLSGVKDSTPGTPQRVFLRVADARGKGVPAVISLAGVDEGVSALEERLPGTARLFSLLHQSLTPTPPDGWPARHDLSIKLPATDTLARVALAAYEARPTLLRSQYDQSAATATQASLSAAHRKRIRMVATLLLWALALIGLVPALRGVLREDGPAAWPVLGVWIGTTLLLLVGTGWAMANAGLLLPSGLPAELPACAIALLMWIAVTVFRYTHRYTTPLMVGVLALTGTVVCLPAFREPATVRALSRPATRTPARLHPPRVTLTPAALRVRQAFPDPLVWQPQIVTDLLGRATITLPAATAPGAWRLNLQALTRDGRMAYASLPYQVQRELAVTADAPPQLTDGDVVTVPVTISNAGTTAHTLVVLVHAEQGLTLDSPASVTLTVPAGGETRTAVSLRASGNALGRLTVTATGDGLTAQAHCRVMVVPAGVRQAVTHSAILREQTTLCVDVPPGIAPHTGDLTLSLYPNAISQLLEPAPPISASLAATLARCYPDVLVRQYRQLHGMKVVTTPKMERTQQEVLQHLLAFEAPGGGFSAFRGQPPTFRLSVLALSALQDLAKVQPVDPAVAERTVNWLVAAWGTATPTERSCAVWPLARGNRRGLAVGWLLHRAETPTALRTEEVAALAVAAVHLKHPLAATLVEPLPTRARQVAGGVYWPAEKGSVMSPLEVTALAVQALAEKSPHDPALPAGTDWLVAHRLPDGAWPDPIASIEAMRALLAVAPTGVPGKVSIIANERPAPAATLKRGDTAVHALLRGLLRPGDNVVELRGPAKAAPLAQLVAHYYAPAPPATAAPLTVRVQYPQTAVRVGQTIDVTVHLTAARPVPLAVVDLPIPPGTQVVLGDLDALRDAGTLARATVDGARLRLDGLAVRDGLTLRYRLLALAPATVTVPAAEAYPATQPAQRAYAPPTRLHIGE